MHDDLPDHDAPEAGSASLETPVTDTLSVNNDETPGFALLAEADAENNVSTAYQVLARKYRPRSFDDLIGQEAMVRTLRNAFTSGRIAHAFMLTGVRGVGKTTTARILARALNYSTPQSQQPSTDLSEEGEHCAAIMEGRHVDVMEMDAASRTGIGDIREIIESVRYRPTSARFKVYIIDEVHMLSTAAFNGLLKTLEEPPPHVKFIFATTEIRRVPVTVLSRCQRFDLRRLSPDDTGQLIDKVCAAEHVALGDEAKGLIARAAEGSARDALSLLDRALAHAGEATEKLDGDTVRRLLGLADRSRIFDLFEAAMAGEVAACLAEFDAQYAMGAEPAVVIADLADVTHWVTRIKFVDDVADDVTLPAEQRQRGRQMASQLSMRHLSRAWQFLQKGQNETQSATNPKAAAEMVLMRLAHLADLPTPDDLVRAYQSEGASGTSANTSGSSPPASSGPTAASSSHIKGVQGDRLSGERATGERAMSERPSPAGANKIRSATSGATLSAAPALADASAPEIGSFEHLLDFISGKMDIGLRHALEHEAVLVSFSPALDEQAGRIEIGLTDDRSTLPQELTRKLRDWTGQKWMVSVSANPTGSTVAQEKQAGEQKLRDHVETDPLVQAVRAHFPDAKITAITDIASPLAVLEHGVVDVSDEGLDLPDSET